MKHGTKHGTLGEALKSFKGIQHTGEMVAGKEGHTHAISTVLPSYRLSHPHPIYSSDWFVPTIGQWNVMLKSLVAKAGGAPVDLTVSADSRMSGSAFSSILTGAGGNALSLYYWTCSEHNGRTAYHYDREGYSGISNIGKTCEKSIRPVFAF